MPAPIVNFEALDNISGYYPPDTVGDVGPNHYVQMVNVSMAVYDKSGNLLYGPFFPSALWPTGDVCAGADDGDPIVVYDQMSDRWLISQFKLPNYPSGPFYECIAISKTGTPTNVPADWYPYTFQVHATKMDDYPKISVWPDGYYMTVNQFEGGGWAGAGVFAFDRAKMLTGQAATFQYFDLFAASSNYGGMLPADLDGSTLPPAGSPAYFFEVDDSSWIAPSDAIRMWKFHVDWTTPANSTFGLASQPNFVLPTANFDLLPCTVSGARTCIPQQSSAQKLDAIADRMMFRATYRNFGSHETVLLNHTVLADGADRAGVRWYELRDLSTTPTIYQQGTYAPADGHYRWMGSLAMDHVGNIALGYSVSSSTLDPSIRYAGRLSTDPLGTLPQAEASIITGSGAQTGTGARWGDYSAMTVDPVDDCTFWYTTEYIQTTGTAPWQTRVASFKFPNCALGPQGTLTGVVSNTATSTPIVGAAVQAVATLTQTGATSTAAGGTYSMLLLTGAYSVTASAFGFLPKTLSNVSISEGVTTTLNIGLDPAPSYVISGTVRDAVAGWPLYAKIDIVGYPYGAIWTDPVTGYYSVTLPSATTYQFNVAAFSAGYTPTTLNVGPVNANATVNVGLNVDAVACVAPGYSLSVTGLLEQFSSNALPAGWAVTSSATCPWTFNDPGVRGNLTGGTGGFAVADSDICGTGTTMSTTLTSPAMNVASLANVNLSFNYDYNNLATAEVAAVDVSADNGTTWSNVVTWNTDQRGPAVFSQDVTSLLSGAAQAKIRFRYVAPGWDWWWEVDNAFVGEKKCLPGAGGLVVGNVTDVNTSLALAGVSIKSPTGSTATIGNGYYTLFSPAGSQPITASLPNYKTEVATASVPLSGTVRQNFALGAGKIAVAPATIAASVSAGLSTTVPLTLTNSGSLTATYSLVELDKGGVPYGPIGKPTYVVKQFRQDGWKNGIGLGIPRPPTFPPYAAGNVLQSWTPTGVTGAWGVAYDHDDNTVWVSSPAAAWGGTNQIFEFTPTGTPSGRSQSYTWAPTNGPADAAYNKNTGTLWVMNINTGVSNCIFEVDPATGPTGNKICPTGATGFATSQRGLAYDPSTDTYFAGSWNDSMVYQFKSDGTLLNSKNVGLAVAGLAYNPTTQHLFVVDSATASKFYVLDAANNYAALGSFSATGFTGGAGLEIDCNGNLWASDQGTGKIFQIESGETADFCASDVPWLSTAPVSGTLASAAVQPVAVTLDGSLVQPGVYNAQLKVQNDTPYSVPNVPVKLTVTAPASWGKLTGNVSTQGYCDASPAVLAGVTVTVQSATTVWDLVTDATGQYNYWLDQSNSPLTLTVSLPGYEFSQLTGV
ncbi:MAG: carboxypeptidase regulatory-like domain-containing protein, partial [Thermoflexales bacterium]|nr:carboxypeptidase regulatory-like domain-containing protein [Thermoflexales bacterium]